MNTGVKLAARSVFLTHDLIACQAAAIPDAVAVQSGAQQLRFLELDQRANRLARVVQALGVGPEVPVGLYFERSVDFVIAALAVLKAGGAYVPLDPAYPPQRIREILNHAGAPVLLSHKWMAASLPGGPWKTVDLDFDAPRIARHSAEKPEVQLTDDNLAYIVFTSGSTGQPKGVEVTHGNLLHLIRWHQRAFSISPSDRASQIAGLGFDAAVWEIWCHLTAGASLHLIDEASRRSPEDLKQWLIANRITIAFVPTILAEYLITFDWPPRTALRFLLTGADTLHRYPSGELPFVLVNNYGPTECTVLVTSGAVSPDTANGHIPTIGRPIDDTEILIMDDQLRPVPIGDEGEICVAGLQVARGYRNLPEVTAQKFAMDAQTGRRIYRTGDLGRFLPNGEISFHGRADDQLKIRGFRVEPDDVVAHLSTHPSVLNAAVLARGAGGIDKTLVGYVVLKNGAKVTATDLREHLQSRLPDYMVPSVFVKLASLPIGATGKCDKQALPAPVLGNLLPESYERETAPHTAQNGTELRIAQLVSGVMDGRSIGREDNFFLAGGHSLMAAQLIARIRDAFAVSLNLRQLFESPTIAALAAAVDRKLATK